MFSRFISANPALTIPPNYIAFNADVVQSVVKRSDDTHEFCKLYESMSLFKLTSQTDRQIPYYQTVSFTLSSVSKTDNQCTCIQRYEVRLLNCLLILHSTLLDPPGLILNSMMLMRSTSEERVGVLYGLPMAFFAIRL